MTPEEKIKALEDQVIEVRHAAVAMVMGMAEAVTNGAEAREDLRVVLTKRPLRVKVRHVDWQNWSPRP